MNRPRGCDVPRSREFSRWTLDPRQFRLTTPEWTCAPLRPRRPHSYESFVR